MVKLRRNAQGLLLSIVFACTAGGRQEDAPAAPFYIANQNPFIQIFGLPRAEPGSITPQGRLDAGFLYYVSNTAIENDTANGETITWDGETAQYTFRFRYGVTEGLELGLDVPFIDHSGGYLDSIIRKTHDLLHMPNDRQDKYDVNQLHYLYRENGTVHYEMDEREAGLGDIRISAAVPLIKPSRPAQRYLALRSQLKLPTGDAGDLLGSGGTDVSAGLALSDYQTLSGIHMILTAHAGMLYMGEADVFYNQQRHVAGYGGVGLDWVVSKQIDLKLQMDMHSAMYDSELDQLGSSIQLLAGGTVRFPGDVLMDLGMTQQLITDATSDVGFFLMIRHLF